MLVFQPTSICLLNYIRLLTLTIKSLLGMTDNPDAGSLLKLLPTGLLLPELDVDGARIIFDVVHRFGGLKTTKNLNNLGKYSNTTGLRRFYIDI